MNRRPFFVVLTVLLLCSVGWSQRLDGTLRGTVEDPSGAVVAGATVTATNEETGAVYTAKTTNAGTYVFPNLLVGPYSVVVQAPTFIKYERRNVQVLPNQIVTADARLTVGSEGTTVEVTGGAETVQTTTSQLSNDFGGQAVSNLPSPGLGGGPLNLAILAPNTTTQGAGVLGEGGSIGGARPRLNSFNIDGVDDNRVDVTGHTTEVIPEAVADFNLVTNMFSAELGHSAGGQFNIVTRSGTNSWHGAAWEFNNNRNFNAMDNLEKQDTTADTCNGTCPRRVDDNRAGAMLGGPIIKNKLFIFGAYQYSNLGLGGTPGVLQAAPTAEGLSILNSLAANEQVRTVLTQIPTVPTATDAVVVNGVSVPIGTFQPTAPNFQNQHDFNINVDANAASHQLRWRFLYNRARSPWVNPDTPLPQFTGATTLDARKILFTDVWSATDKVVNDFRLSYSRFNQGFTVPSQFTNFPNVIIDELGLNIGPESNSPQSGIQNTYQVADTITLVQGQHTFRFGGEFRKWIAPSDFLPRSRGEWDYSTLSSLINDLVPDGLNGALRGAGRSTFDGNQHAIYGFLQDDWKIHPRLTLNLGLRYEWYSNPKDVKTQELNAISNIPGVRVFPDIANLPQEWIFREPKTDKNNFMPRIGFAWDPMGDAKWAVRGGFGVSFDVTPQNFPLLQLPPQLQSEQNPEISCGLSGQTLGYCAGVSPTTGAQQFRPGFLAGGGLLTENVPPATPEEARLATQGMILDTVQPKVLTWTLGVQRELFSNTSLELRYLGTRSTALPVQARLNTISAFDRGLTALPTFFSAAEVPATITGGSRLLDFEEYDPSLFPEFSLMTSFPAIGGSIYHGASADLYHRFARGLMFRANYTWAKNIDDSTNELFSSRVNPRRPLDWANMELDRGRSVLDINHKFTMTWMWEIPRVATENGFLRGVLHGWQWTGTYIAQSGQPVTILADADSNANGDSAGDRAILNARGIGNTGTTVGSYVCVGAGGATSVVGIDLGCPGGSASVAGYVAADPNARYVQAELGTRTNLGRNTFTTPGLNIWNMGAIKDTRITERFSVQFRAEAFNVFNHRNFSLAQPSVFQSGSIIGTVNNALSASYSNVTAQSGLFLNPKQFSGGSRTMTLGLKLIW
ncbi:MAG TPA: TonB-dependent receptor [Terriglobales bacterium]|nr:TonB-dependent receptor [Terriglobales bacterium]